MWPLATRRNRRRPSPGSPGLLSSGPSHRTGDQPGVPRGARDTLPAVTSALAVRSRSRRRYPDDHPAFSLHAGSVGVPVLRLAGDPAVVLHERLHGGGQRHHLGRALDVHPVAEEGVAEHAQLCPRVGAQVLGLEGRFPAADGQPPFVVHADENRTLLDPGPGAGRQHRPVVRSYEVACSVEVHGPSVAHGHGGSRSFSRTAYITASMRECSCSFSRMLRTWFFTVFSLMNSRLAISRLFSPWATSLSTSSSRSVSRGVGTCCRSERDICLNSSRSLIAIDGLIRDWPSATTRIAWATSSIEESLRR